MSNEFCLIFAYIWLAKFHTHGIFLSLFFFPLLEATDFPEKLL